MFFIVLGTHLVLDETLVLISCLLLGQVLSAGLAARYTGNFNWAESWMIGFGMLGRGKVTTVRNLRNVWPPERPPVAPGQYHHHSCHMPHNYRSRYAQAPP